jgi:uncharacterized protein YjbI with pentapeptide repeats
MPCSRQPPRFEAALFAKTTCRLAVDDIAAWADEPALVSGDVYFEDDPTRGLRYPSDFAPFKPRADVLIVGAAYAPGATPVTVLPVSFRVGSLTKSVIVSGERRWNAAIRAADTEPQPFVSLPVSYAFAFGGAGYEKNPIGRGADSDVAPQIENPVRHSRGVESASEPAGFGPLSSMWPQRAALLGTYDDKWLKTRWPWFPADFDWGYFNSAPRDQQIDTYLRGDEPLAFRNLHPTLPVFHSRLPGVRVRCFVNERLADEQLRYREVPLALDTVWIDPAAMTLILVWRGVTAVRTFKFKEIEDIQIVAESLGERADPPETYREALMTAAVLDVDSEGSPPPPTAADVDSEIVDVEREMADMDDQLQNMENEIARAEAEALSLLGQHKAAIESAGASIDFPPELAAPGAADIAAAFAAVTEALKRHSPQDATLMKEFDTNELASVEREMQAVAAEAQQAEDETPEFSVKWTREAVIEHVGRGESLIGQDLRGLDLSGVNFAAGDLRNVILLNANLAGATLVATRLSGADLSGANLTDADMSKANIDGADLTDAIAKKVSFQGASLRSSTLARVDLTGADLSAVEAAEADFSEAQLPGAKFVGANLARADFTRCDASEAIFIGADLQLAQMHGVKARAINCEGCNLTGFQATERADFTAGNFRGVRASGAVFEDSGLDMADFSGAHLQRAQFGEASLGEARFERANLMKAAFDDARLVRALFRGADLRGATFDRADLTEANFQAANAYEAGFWLVQASSANFAGANLKSTLLG